ncbi:M18 family aminopeptidase [Selenomonas sp.]|uniref:M18 family aminopeptidase n=1 Tax=Selenomonas sp. TaxID=2053611 RepID=UPI0025DC4E31|nr:M18 family aminopeptidase [Selenomonas sp.]MBQ1868136.1 M18 family aminopeptidase [Selenomonas sp.]
MNTETEELLDFVAECPTPFHTVQASAMRLRLAGFRELSLTDSWQIERGGKYFVTVYDSTLLAFVVGESDGQLRMAAAHTDFPCFRLKPQAGMVKEKCGLLNVEKYGGLILRTWLDRPLSLAGKIVVRGEDAFNPEIRLVDFERPLATIPSLAIHMDREVNDEGKLNVQTDMLPLAAVFGGVESLEADADAKTFFVDWLAEELGTAVEDILSYELSLYPVEHGCTVGLHEEMVSSPRLDNLTSVKACLDGICGAAETGTGIRLIALFDNEEVGSCTKQGAASAVLMQVLERLYTALGKSQEDLLRDIAAGFLLSVDVAHAVHPNYADKADPAVRPVLGAGLTLKQACSQSYAGDAEAVAVVRGLCEAQGIKWQQFVNRSDSRGGSTLGSIASALVPMRTMDIGVPILAMHSVRETMAGTDQEALSKLLQVFMGD